MPIEAFVGIVWYELSAMLLLSFAVLVLSETVLELSETVLVLSETVLVLSETVLVLARRVFLACRVFLARRFRATSNVKKPRPIFQATFSITLGNV